MSLPDEQWSQLLKRIFDFLDDRDFTIDRSTWLGFCQDHHISTKALQAHKTKLIAQLSSAIEGELHRNKLEQIFCCDPFDFQVASDLRNLWHQKSQLQPEPFQQWAYALSANLFQLNTDNLSQTPVPPPQSPPSSPTPSPPPVSSNQAWKKTVVKRGLIGASILISMLLIKAIILAGQNSQQARQEHDDKINLYGEENLKTTIGDVLTTQGFKPTSDQIVSRTTVEVADKLKNGTMIGYKGRLTIFICNNPDNKNDPKVVFYYPKTTGEVVCRIQLKRRIAENLSKFTKN